jgi:hypothetical protein
MTITELVLKNLEEVRAIRQILQSVIQDARVFQNAEEISVTPVAFHIIPGDVPASPKSTHAYGVGI